MENINDVNFFNELRRDNPLAYKDFIMWLETYKEDNNFDFLFSNHLLDSEDTVTFSDLFLDMQVGIMMRYFNESPNLYHPIGNVSCYGDIQYVLSAFQMYFIMIDGDLSEEKKKNYH